MAGEIQVSYSTGLNLYAVRRLGELVLYPATGVFEQWGTGARTAADYAIALTESQNVYIGDFAADVTIGVGIYIVQIYERMGAVPADSDPLVGSGEIVWDGTKEVTESGGSGTGNGFFVQGG